MAEQKKQYWLHRINGGENGTLLSHPLLMKYNLLSIGWSFLSSEEVVKNIQEQGVSAIKRLYVDRGIDIKKNIYSLSNFVSIMRKDDIIIVPIGKIINIYRIADDVVLTNETLPVAYLQELNVLRDENFHLSIANKEVDLGFYRKVELVVQGFLRSELDAALYKKTRTFQTNLLISDVNDSIELLISAYKQKRKKEGLGPIEYSQLTEKLKSSLEDIKANLSFDERLIDVFKDMHSLIKNGVQFEYAPYGNKNQKKLNIIISYGELHSFFYGIIIYYYHFFRVNWFKSQFSIFVYI